MGDAENQPSKKRAAGVQLSRDNPGLDDDEETPEQESGTFKRASEEVLATRKIVRVRRQTSSVPSAAAEAPASNPFAAIRLASAAPSAPPPLELEASSVTSKETDQIGENDSKSENKVDEVKDESSAVVEKTDINDDNAKQSESKVDESKAPEPNAEKDKTSEVSEKNINKSGGGEATEDDNSGDGAKKSAEADLLESEKGNDVENKEKDSGEATTEKNTERSPFSSFQQLSSNQNAFSGISGTGFSSSMFSFGSVPKDGSTSGTGSLFGLKTDQPTFNFGNSNNGNSSIFGTAAASIVSKSESSKIPSMQEVTVETGEENEKAVFTADSILFEYIDGSWKERGKGELKVNVSTTGTEKARLVMRARGNYRLILNASLFPDMKLTKMDKKGITFACVNTAGDGKDGLSTIALKFKDASIVEDFQAAVEGHKGKTTVTLKTPESSP
ncbi:hypothetical protein ACJIZ3_025501 [Penstemon smallii]|uniref:RanBD1 domain-containing protein n=1 Tax=Penstemon smallii TaxID=265156 RepID=A0ABD3TXD1_9LAMI